MTLRKAYFMRQGWYNKAEETCKKEIRKYLDEYKNKEVNLKNIISGVVPHAGWSFSGKLSCFTISLFKDISPDTVVIFGGHMSPNSSTLLYNEEEWETPFGNLQIDLDILQELKENTVKEQFFNPDNTIEVQLPFIKYFFPNSKILPLRPPSSMGAVDIGKKVAEITKKLGKKVISFGSTDLTHYGSSYNFVPKGSGDDAIKWVKEVNDIEFIDFSIKFDEAKLLEHAKKNHSACSSGAVAAVSSFSKEMGANKAEIVDYFTSSDIEYNPSHFVGYAGIVYGS